MNNGKTLSSPDNNGNSPKATIGLPVYNGADYIREAIDSLLSQSFKDFEVLISDNASTDETEKICRSYAAKDNRIHYVRQAKNIGGAANFNYVLGQARGEYFKWLAHDDYIDSGFLSATFGYLDAHPEVVLCSTDLKVVDETNAVLRIGRMRTLREDKEWAQARLSILRWSKIWREGADLPFSGVYRLKKIQECTFPKAGLFGLASGNEYILLVQIALRGKVVGLPGAMTAWRNHKKSFSSVQFNNTFWPKIMLNYFYLLGQAMCFVAKSDLPAKEKTHILSLFFFIELPKLALDSFVSLGKCAVQKIKPMLSNDHIV